MNDEQNTSIIRTVKNKEHPYILLDKEPIKNKKLSWKAKGLLTYFMSLPDDWSVNLVEIAGHATDGLTSFWSGVKELKVAGYILHTAMRDKKKRIKKHVYFIRENLQVDFPNVENLNLENVTLLSNKNTNKRNKLSNDCRDKPDGKTIIKPFDRLAATKLHNIILSKKNIHLNTSQWPNTFRMLRTNNKIPKARIKEVLIWYKHHIGEDYVPVAHCAKTFREKFTRIEDAMRRCEQEDNDDEVTSTYRMGGDGKMGWYVDE